ncbi:hypothetical protein ACX84U_07880, partial [Burkholderia pseudomallei]
MRFESPTAPVRAGLSEGLAGFAHGLLVRHTITGGQAAADLARLRRERGKSAVTFAESTFRSTLSAIVAARSPAVYRITLPFASTPCCSPV